MDMAWHALFNYYKKRVEYDRNQLFIMLNFDKADKHSFLKSIIKH